MIAVDLTDAEARRFWSKVALPDVDGCMLWIPKVKSHGYPTVKIRGRDLRAGRVSAWLSDGPPPSEKDEAAHSCRNRHCVAPAHLRWATRVANEADKIDDGTDIRGERHGRAKLTWPQVREMRVKAARGISYSRLAAEYGISRGQVGWIIRGKYWVEQPSDAVLALIGGDAQ